MDMVHEYLDSTVQLTLFNAAIVEDVPQKLEHNDIIWVRPSENPKYNSARQIKTLKRIIEAYNVKRLMYAPIFLARKDVIVEHVTPDMIQNRYHLDHEKYST